MVPKTLSSDILILGSGGAGLFAALHAHGFGDDEIWDIGAIAAFFGMSNRIVNFASIAPNDEFYLMGRLPKA